MSGVGTAASATSPAQAQQADLKALLRGPGPLLALAPMRDVSHAAFWRLLHERGGADAYWTEYLRVHPMSRLEKRIVAAICSNPTGRPIVAQMIGRDAGALVRTAQHLQTLPVAAIELNLGCPAPVVCRKGAGGGLLRELGHVDTLLAELRAAIRIPLFVKTRIGYDTEAGFDELLAVLARRAPDLVTVHGRTVRQAYRPPVRYDLIGRAARALPCPVLANGDIQTADQALAVLASTRARGLMIGRGAVRNPWLFAQIRERLRGQPATAPTGRDLLAYLEALWEANCTPGAPERLQAQRMKLFANFIGEGLAEKADGFLHAIRRAQTRAEFFAICRDFLDHPMPLKLAATAGD
mgnify:CR=1 FL=1